MNIYKRAILYMNCVTDIQRYLLKHADNIPPQTLQEINAIIIKLLKVLENDEE